MSTLFHIFSPLLSLNLIVGPTIRRTTFYLFPKRSCCVSLWGAFDLSAAIRLHVLLATSLIRVGSGLSARLSRGGKGVTSNGILRRTPSQRRSEPHCQRRKMFAFSRVEIDEIRLTSAPLSFVRAPKHHHMRAIEILISSQRRSTKSSRQGS